MPSGALLTGYDFMKDGATALADTLGASLTAAGGSAPASVRTIDDTWTKAQLQAALSSTPQKRVNAIYAHYDFDKAVTAAGYTDGVDTLSPAELRAALPDGAQLLISMGCHSGLSVPDGSLPTSGEDFAQASQLEGAAYVGVTGFGYGDAASTGLHERLLLLYGEQLGFAQDIGSAMRRAKQQYFAQQGLYGNADEKTLATTVLFGLPMYRIGAAAPAVPAPSLTAPEPAAEGVSVASKLLSPTFSRVDTPTGSFFRANGEAPQVTPGRPVQPRVTQEVTARSGTGALLPAHGALVTSLSIGSELTGFDGAFSRPVTDLAANEPERAFGETVFPSSLAAITTYDDPAGPKASDGTGTRQNLVVLPGQFRGDGTADGQGVGVQRLFDAVGVDVQYSSSDDYTQPAVTAVRGVLQPGDNPRAEFSLRAQDPSGVRRVLVLWRTNGDYENLDLSLSNGVWQGTAPVPAGTTAFEYFVQVVDGAGNVATASGKGAGLTSVPPMPPVPPAHVSVEDTSVTEGSGAVNTTVRVPVTLAAPSPGAVTVPWSLAGGTATAGADYVDATGTVTVPAGSLSATIPVTVLGDDAVEPNESFSVVLGEGPGRQLDRKSAVVTVIDDDAARAVEVSVGDTAVAETTGNATVPITLSAQASGPVTVGVSTDPGTATAGNDYTATTTSVTIPAGATGTTVNVPVLDDSLDEPDETFTVRLTSATGATVRDAEGTVTVTDDDIEPTVSVEDARIGEGTGSTSTAARLTVRLDGASSRAVSVPYSVTQGTATSADADLSSGTVTFQAEATTAQITVPVLADALDEDDETLTVTLGTPTGATVSRGAATLTIADDDAEPTVRVADVSVPEGTGATPTTASVTVTLDAPSGRVVTLPWSLAAGTATAADDFALADGVVRFEPGQTARDFGVQLAADGLDEDDETVRVLVGTPVNALGESAEAKDAVVTILDDDGEPRVSVADATVSESAGTATVTVTLGGPSGRQVTVPWVVTGGTATAGQDFQAGSGTVTFTPGVTSQTFDVTVLPDELDATWRATLPP
jgi:hypothetical protein